jgi:hypothetical protein
MRARFEAARDQRLKRISDSFAAGDPRRLLAETVLGIVAAELADQSIALGQNDPFTRLGVSIRSAPQARLFDVAQLRWGFPGFAFIGDDLFQVIDAITRESCHAIPADCVDMQAAVFGEHVDREIEQPVLGSCPNAWCRSDDAWRVGPPGRAGTAESLTVAVSLTVLIASSVM